MPNGLIDKNQYTMTGNFKKPGQSVACILKCTEIKKANRLIRFQDWDLREKITLDFDSISLRNNKPLYKPFTTPIKLHDVDAIPQRTSFNDLRISSWKL